MENRAAVFTSSSQDVEVYSAGAWWSGSLLGWRHEPDGSCQVWVRALVGGAERSAWTDLADVRLPERPALHPVAPCLGGDAGRVALTSTISLFAVRDGAAQDPAGPATVVGGRRPGGRRRAPEQDAPSEAREELAGSGTPAPPGRHRAPAPAETVVPGRHRAADTGVFPAVPADAPGAGRRTPVPTRSHRTGDAWGATAEATGRLLPVLPEQGGAPDDGEFYTRPLRLATSAPQPRSSHWDH